MKDLTSLVSESLKVGSKSIINKRVKPWHKKGETLDEFPCYILFMNVDNDKYVRNCTPIVVGSKEQWAALQGNNIVAFDRWAKIKEIL